MPPDYPRLVRPDILKNLNEEVFNILKLPLFLHIEHLPLSSLKESINSFPGLAALLYCIYHDYSRGLLDICLKKEYLPHSLQNDPAFMAKRNSATEHYENICYRLRNGFYHGYYPEHEVGVRFPGILEKYTGVKFSNDSDNGNIHNNIKSISRGAWAEARKKLVQEADDLYAYIVEWKNRIAVLDQDRITSCRNRFIDKKFRDLWIDKKFMVYILNGLLLRQGKRQDISNRTYENKLNNSVTKINNIIKDKIGDAGMSGEFNKPEHIYMGIIDMIEELIDENPKFSLQSTAALDIYDIPEE